MTSVFSEIILTFFQCKYGPTKQMFAGPRIVPNFVKEFWFSQILLNDILNNFFIFIVIDIFCFVFNEPLKQIGGIFHNLLERFPRKLVIVAIVQLSF